MPGSTPNMGLTTWPNLTDVFNHTALANNWTAVDGHDHTLGKGVQVPSGGIATNAISTTKVQDGAITSVKVLDGAVTTPKLADLNVTTVKLADLNVTTGKLQDNSVTSAKLGAGVVTNNKLDAATVANISGISTTGTVRRGKSIIATQEDRVNAAYGLMTTPDQVQGIVLPTDGLIAVIYEAIWANVGGGSNNTVKAAIFLGGTQLKSRLINSVPVVQETSALDLNAEHLLYTTPAGLTTQSTTGVGNTGADVTTGQIAGSSSPVGTFGGPVLIQAAAGTYDISIQFKADINTVRARSRHLWVWTIGF